ncbi:MAG TPA: UPF0175 family protein [Blastocatellia bacterium]|nr:UPF0175 family protein [Blastocatellia bacterium]
MGEKWKSQFNIPDEVAASIQAGNGKLSKRLLEAYALDAYRSGELTSHQVDQLLGFESPMETDAFLKQHGAYIEYTEAEIDAQRRALQDAIRAR